MKKILILILLFFIRFTYCQNIGIVSNINPKLGYTHAKAGVIKFNTIFEKELDYNLIDFIEQTIIGQNKNKVKLNNFNWNNLGYFDKSTTAKPILDYLNNYCKNENIGELIIVRKVNSFNLIGPMDMFFDLNHNFGLMTFPSSQNRVLMYYNFEIYKYSLNENKIYLPILKKNEKMDVYLNKNFKEPIYNNEKLLKDKTAQNYFLPIFENFIKSSILKLINQKEKEVFIFKK